MLKTLEAIKPRDIYLNRLIAFQDTEPVKVITGIRRCGKSSFLKLMQKHLLETGIEARQIISMNFESMKQGNRKNSRQRNRNENYKNKKIGKKLSARTATPSF